MPETGAWVKGRAQCACMADVGGRLRVKSALNPALWLCAVVTVPLAGFATFVEGPTWLMVCLVVLAFLPPVLAGIGFVVFPFRDPDKLQSEEYQIRKRTLEMIGEKGQGASLMDLDGLPEVLHWRFDLPNAFYLVSEVSAKELANKIRPLGNGRFIVTEIPANSQGWLPRRSWEIITKKKVCQTPEETDKATS